MQKKENQKIIRIWLDIFVYKNNISIFKSIFIYSKYTIKIIFFLFHILFFIEKINFNKDKNIYIIKL